MKFNSQICTTKEQSERLIALGLKKETADMWYPHFAKTCPIPLVDENLASDDIPAWSLHRLIEMMPDHLPFTVWIGHLCVNRERIFYWGEETVFESWDNGLTIYDNIIDCIEWLIKEGHFNKEYLEETL